MKLKRLLYFTRSENRGIIVLLILLAGLIAIRHIQKNKNQDFNLQYSKSEIEYKQGDKNTFGSANHSKNKNKGYATKTDFKPFAFDPNTANLGSLNSLGFPSYISARIIKYRESGGAFSEPVDLYSIYGIDSMLVTDLISYIVIDDEYKRTSIVRRKNTESNLTIDINMADTTSLASLRGIGPVLSRRITNFRNSIGGFYSTKQIIEVYGIDDSLYHQISARLVVDSSLVKKINLNTTSFEELAKHPYISRYEAKAILAYRRIIGEYSSIIELRENYILSETTYQKAIHYFSIN